MTVTKEQYEKLKALIKLEALAAVSRADGIGTNGCNKAAEQTEKELDKLMFPEGEE